MGDSPVSGGAPLSAPGFGRQSSGRSGAPTVPASPVRPAPSQQHTRPEGNPVDRVVEQPGESPALLVTIRFLHAGSIRRVTLPWSYGMTISSAFKQARLRDSIFRLINPRGYARIIGKQRIHSINHPLQPGDELRLNPAMALFF